MLKLNYYNFYNFYKNDFDFYKEYKGYKGINKVLNTKMANAGDYLSRFYEDYNLSDREVIDRINSTLYDEHPPSNSYSIPYSIYDRGMGNSTRRQTQQIQDEKLTEEQLAKMKQEWDKYERVEQPENLSIKLFPHQLVSIYNMERMERVRKVKARTNDDYYITNFGVLGDIPGYGKSYSIVALILRDKMPWNVEEEHENSTVISYNSHLKMVRKTKKKRVGANLVLASPTLISQWKDYFSSIKSPFKIKEISNKKDITVNFKPNDWDVVLVNTTRFNDLINCVLATSGQVVWKRFIFDEAASTHISGMRHVDAGFTWFVSATYTDLLRTSGTRHHYMRDFFADINQDLLKLFVVKNPTHFVKHSFKMPKVIEIEHVCLNPRVLNVLSNYIDHETKTMISAGDIKGAISRIGGGVANEANLFEMVSKKQKEKLAQSKFSLEFWKGRNNPKEIENWEKRVKECEKIIQELEEKYKTILQEDCSICFSKIENPILLPCCQNIFCAQCIIRWMDDKHSCPMCRSRLNGKDLVYVNSKADEKDDEKEDKKEDVINKTPKQKQQTVLDIVSKGLAEEKKFLIFSMYDESFSIIRRELDDNKIDFVEISGTKATRDSKIRKFKEGKVNVVFLNSRFNGAGINLENATDIILYHDMPPSIREQVIGRALRIGREEDLTIHNLVYGN